MLQYVHHVHYVVHNRDAMVEYGSALVSTGREQQAMTLLAAHRKAAELLPTDGEMAKNERLRENKYLIDKGLKELGAPEPPPKDR